MLDLLALAGRSVNALGGRFPMSRLAISQRLPKHLTKGNKYG
jgi:hypothetical protein